MCLCLLVVVGLCFSVGVALTRAATGSSVGSCSASSFEPCSSPAPYDSFCREEDGRCLPAIVLIGAAKAASSTLMALLSAARSVTALCRDAEASHLTERLEGTDLQLQHCTLHLAAESDRWGAAAHEVDFGAGPQEPPRDWPAQQALAKLWKDSPSKGVSNPRMGMRAALDYQPVLLYDDDAPGRIEATFRAHHPDLAARLRFIVVLREPVSRAVSSYWFHWGNCFSDFRLGHHNGSGGSAAHAMSCMRAEMQAVDAIERRCSDNRTSTTATCLEAARHREKYGKGRAAFVHHVGKSVYVSQLQNWFLHFPRCRFFIVSMERFFGRGAAVTEACYTDLFSWAGLPTLLDGDELAKLATRHENRAHNPHEQPLPAFFLRAMGAWFAPRNKALSRELGSEQIFDEWRAARPEYYEQAMAR